MKRLEAEALAILIMMIGVDIFAATAIFSILENGVHYNEWRDTWSFDTLDIGAGTMFIGLMLYVNIIVIKVFRK